MYPKGLEAVPGLYEVLNKNPLNERKQYFQNSEQQLLPAYT